MAKIEKQMPQKVASKITLKRCRCKAVPMPEVGIFWIDDSGTMHAESVSLKEAADYGECKIFEGSHYDLWNKAVSANPKWRGLEYEEIPRGRVVYRNIPKNPEFVVYLPQRIIKFRDKVLVRFKLPPDHVRFDTSDEHYQL